MLKDILTQMHGDDAMLSTFLVNAGVLDANSSPERVAAVQAELRADLVAAGITAPIAAPVEPAPVPVDGMKPVDPASQA